MSMVLWIFQGLLRLSLALLTASQTSAMELEKQKAQSVKDVFESQLLDMLHDKNSLDEILRTITVFSDQQPTLEPYLQGQQLIDFMTENQTDTKTWPKFFSLKHTTFYAPKEEQAQIANVLKLLKQFEEKEEYSCRKVGESARNYAFSLMPVYKIGNSRDLIKFLALLATLRPHVTLENEDVYPCPMCFEPSEAGKKITIDQEAINPDVCVRLSCKHLYHLNCLDSMIAHGRITCAVCGKAFDYRSYDIECSERKPTISEIKALHRLSRVGVKPGFCSRLDGVTLLKYSIAGVSICLFLYLTAYNMYVLFFKPFRIINDDGKLRLQEL